MSKKEKHKKIIKKELNWEFGLVYSTSTWNKNWQKDIKDAGGSVQLIEALVWLSNKNNPNSKIEVSKDIYKKDIVKNKKPPTKKDPVKEKIIDDIMEALRNNPTKRIRIAELGEVVFFKIDEFSESNYVYMFANSIHNYEPVRWACRNGIEEALNNFRIKDLKKWKIEEEE